MSEFSGRVADVLNALKVENAALLIETAHLKQQLAAALANDAADAQAIADATVAAQAAKAQASTANAEIIRLNAELAADDYDDAALEALLGAYEPQNTVEVVEETVEEVPAEEVEETVVESPAEEVEETVEEVVEEVEETEEVSATEEGEVNGVDEDLLDELLQSVEDKEEDVDL
jgi:hypothetical protein